MLDIDDFKQFNDRFGHPVGDLVLVEVGKVLTEQLRRHVDLAARYGGEEFAILLPNTSRDGAQVVGDRLVREVAALSQADADVPASPPALEASELPALTEASTADATPEPAEWPIVTR